MISFKTWLENAEIIDVKEQKELQSIWADTFKALGIGGLSDEDAAQQSLSKITFNQRSGETQNNVFKGKRAASKRLENGQIFNRLEKLNDPDIKNNIEDVRKWLDTTDSEHAANASTTVSTLLQKLFGQETFQQFIDSDFPKFDSAKAEMPPQPPKQDTGVPPEAPAPDNAGQNPGQPPMNGMMGDQPQANAAQQIPPVQNPMPPKPAGAEMGMF
jgi:hypothetical protein